MKIVKKADGKTVVEISEQEWQGIGASYGWFRNDPALVEAASRPATQKQASKPQPSSVNLDELKERLAQALNSKPKR